MGRWWSSGCAVAMLAGLMTAGPAASQPDPAGTWPGRTYLTGDGSLHYRHGTTMLGPLAVFAILFAELIDDDDDGDAEIGGDWGSAPCVCHGCCGWDRGRFPLEAYQLGSSAGMFVAGGLTLGLRLVAQGNDEGDPVRRFWGVGPEVGWFPGGPVNRLRPFLAAASLHTRGRPRSWPPTRIVAGPAWQIRGGLSCLTGPGGLYLQTSYQTAPRDRRTRTPISQARWGAGLGLIFFLR